MNYKPGTVKLYLILQILQNIGCMYRYRKFQVIYLCEYNAIILQTQNYAYQSSLNHYSARCRKKIQTNEYNI